MKKYTIKDNSGAKKTIFAKDLAHILKLNDDIRPEFVPEKIRKIAEAVAKKVNAIVTYDGFDKHITVYFKPKSSVISNNFEEILDKELSRYGWKIGSFGRNGLSFYAKDSIKDEANKITTLQALITDEEAAIKAYEVAIKNLENQLDDDQKQVLVSILKDERRHVENLYAVINNKVTEKNITDSYDKLLTIFNARGSKIAVLYDKTAASPYVVAEGYNKSDNSWKNGVYFKTIEQVTAYLKKEYGFVGRISDSRVKLLTNQ